PPFGFALFYLRGVAPAIVKTLQIYKGAIAFIALQLVGLVIAASSPSLVNYLPNRAYLTSDTAPPPNNPRLQGCLEPMVFADYRANQVDIEQAIERVSAVDIGYLPDNYQQNLRDSYRQMSKVFTEVDKVETATSAFQDYQVEYEPIHRESRALQRLIRNNNKSIEEYEQEIDSLRFSGQPDQDDIDALNARIADLTAENRAIEDQIPEQWEAARKQYLELAKQEKIARNKYRRTVDDSYQVVRDTLQMVRSSTALADLKPAIEELHQVIREAEIEDAIEQIKQLESDLSAIKNAHPIKSKLSRARRALQREQNRDKAVGELIQGLEQLDQEVSWRSRAAQDYLPQLEQFNATIKGNIGLRMQSRISVEQAEAVASCLAEHKDISLAF
nr:C4-dicarboxylate ABC transporter permease [Gammaproteobacteria bacterium]